MKGCAELPFINQLVPSLVEAMLALQHPEAFFTACRSCQAKFPSQKVLAGKGELKVGEAPPATRERPHGCGVSAGRDEVSFGEDAASVGELCLGFNPMCAGL